MAGDNLSTFGMRLSHSWQQESGKAGNFSLGKYQANEEG